jgi:hypothetical protein
MHMGEFREIKDKEFEYNLRLLITSNKLVEPICSLLYLQVVETFSLYPFFLFSFISFYLFTNCFVCIVLNCCLLKKLDPQALLTSPLKSKFFSRLLFTLSYFTSNPQRLKHFETQNLIIFHLVCLTSLKSCCLTNTNFLFYFLFGYA